MKTSSKGKSEMLGRMQWKSKGMSEMLGRMQWKHLAKVVRNVKECNEEI